jgi:hypothetical protein
MPMKEILDDYPVIDGFTLNTTLRCDLSFEAMVLDKYKYLRRAKGLRTKILTIPEDPASIVIPARDSYEYEVKCKPGAAYWGYTFVASKGNFSWSVREACTEEPLVSEVVLSCASGPPYPQQFLSKLLVVPIPGLLTVTICSLVSSDTANVQLILWGGEPA